MKEDFISFLEEQGLLQEFKDNLKGQALGDFLERHRPGSYLLCGFSWSKTQRGKAGTRFWSRVSQAWNQLLYRV